MPQSSENCLSSVLQKMFHLKSLWQDTLPLSNYRRSIGAILNAILEELIQTVIGVEDITKGGVFSKKTRQIIFLVNFFEYVLRYEHF